MRIIRKVIIFTQTTSMYQYSYLFFSSFFKQIHTLVLLYIHLHQLPLHITLIKYYPSCASLTVSLSSTILPSLTIQTSQSSLLPTIQSLTTYSLQSKRHLLTKSLYHQSVIFYPQSNHFYHPHHHYYPPVNHQLLYKQHLNLCHQ